MDQAKLLEIFSFSMSPLELVIRGSVFYVFLFLIFRFVLRRDVGSIAISDVLLLVLIADASQNAMAGDYKTVADGAVLVSTIVGWNWVLDWAAWRFEAVHRLLQAPPLPLVRHGRILHRNLRKEFLTVDDLMTELRKQEVTELSTVKLAQMEGDGQISVLKREAGGGAPQAQKQRQPQ